MIMKVFLLLALFRVRLFTFVALHLWVGSFVTNYIVEGISIEPCDVLNLQLGKLVLCGKSEPNYILGRSLDSLEAGL
jgi:hypothetical protein